MSEAVTDDDQSRTDSIQDVGGKKKQDAEAGIFDGPSKADVAKTSMATMQYVAEQSENGNFVKHAV